MIAAKVIGIFIIVLIGYGANKIGWLPLAASKHISSILINISAPCVVVLAMAEQELNLEKLGTVLGMVALTGVGYGASWLIALGFSRAARVEKENFGIFANFFLFTNNGNLGFAVALALFGREGLFLLAMMNCFAPLMLYTVGAGQAKRDAALRGNHKPVAWGVREVLNAPIIATIIGLFIYFFRIPLPAMAIDVLGTVGATMTPLAMIMIGLQLTESRPKAIIGNKRLVAMSAVRLIIIPLGFFAALLPFHLPALVVSVVVLNFMLPPAVVPVALAEQYGADAKLAAEGTFLATLFSMITLPVASVLLQLGHF